jgi:hypothetical protein
VESRGQEGMEREARWKKVEGKAIDLSLVLLQVSNAEPSHSLLESLVRVVRLDLVRRVPAYVVKQSEISSWVPVDPRVEPEDLVVVDRQELAGEDLLGELESSPLAFGQRGRHPGGWVREGEGRVEGQSVRFANERRSRPKPTDHRTLLSTSSRAAFFEQFLALVWRTLGRKREHLMSSDRQAVELRFHLAQTPLSRCIQEHRTELRTVQSGVKRKRRRKRSV